MSRARSIMDLLARPRVIPYGEHPCQVGELRLPAGPGPHPVAVVIHGGSWQAEYGKFIMRPLAADLTRLGWATWNIEYRRVGKNEGGGWPNTFLDVASAIDALPDLDAPLDLSRVAVVGHSAGGHLALWAAGRVGLPPGAPGAQPRVTLSAAVSLAGVCDLIGAYEEIPGGGAIQGLMGASPQKEPARYALANPLQQVPLGLPILLVHGTHDVTVSVARSRDYERAARMAAAPVTLVEIPGRAGRHRSQIDPDQEGWLVAREWLRRRAAAPVPSVPA